ncbi:hypothetical protein [Cesiribacter andamanensis]|nr:hypothetical protein [Cesiribacter andamanensis]
MYTGLGALVGVGVLLLGVGVLLAMPYMATPAPGAATKPAER